MASSSSWATLLTHSCHRKFAQPSLVSLLPVWTYLTSSRSGNGATQAIDDAVSLARCIALANTKEHLSEATRVHNLLRFQRVSCLQAFGILNREKAQSAANNDRGRVPHVGRWMTEHDVEQYVNSNYLGALAHIQLGTPFQNTNIPPGMQYHDWTIDSLIEAQRKGEPTVLDGDWE